MESKHTPTRGGMYVKADAITGSASVHEAPLDGESIHGPSIAWFADANDARAYLRAVNAHERLVEALTDCTDWMRANLIDSDLSGIDSYKRARALLAEVKS